MGHIRRNLNRIDVAAFNILYKGYIRPHLEYAAQAWSPHLGKDVDCLERIQRKATKVVHGMMRKCYAERLQVLGLTIEMYKKQGKF